MRRKKTCPCEAAKAARAREALRSHEECCKECGTYPFKRCYLGKALARRAAEAIYDRSYL